MKPMLYSLLFCCFAIPVIAGDELLSDGNFELGSANWTYVNNSTLDQLTFIERSAGWGVDAVFRAPLLIRLR